MVILGIGGSTHDFSYCLLKDGTIIGAIEEERVSREKHSKGVHSQALGGMKCLLKQHGLSYEDVDIFISNSLWYGHTEYPFFSNIIRINHHLAHACSSYYNSGFDESALLVIDGSGDQFLGRKWSTISLGYASGKKPSIFESVYGTFKKASGDGTDIYDQATNSLGELYSSITCCCGFGRLNEGKTMGLAPYGSDRYVKEMEQFVKISLCNKNLDVKVNISDLNRWANEIVLKDESFENKAALAYAGQAILEESVFHIMNVLYDKTKCKNLCYAGGTALNSVLNGKIKKKTPFENIYIFPAAGDAGTSFGAAQYAHYVLCNSPYQAKKMATCFLGGKYDDHDIETVLKKYENQIIVEYINDTHNMTKKAAELLNDGKIIGWFQGESEIGPRALGNRSILADPRNPYMKDIINSKIKFRESFRPFAPVVLKEQMKNYFITDFDDNPYMLYVAEVCADKKNMLGAVTHVDGSARLQTVTIEQNPLYYKVIDEFYKLTSVPVLLNTSLNTKGEPIVEKPEEAIRCLLESDLDGIFIHSYYIAKYIPN
jgi:carbamoyltransferase